MARTLPWLKSGSAGGPSRARGQKRQRIASPASDEEGEHSGKSTPQKKAKPKPAHTPSSSPPALPSPEKHMHEGFDKDDLYIMVEDQFQSIAQSFTQHLHKAEYRRLTDQAKKQKASTIRDISRPTDAFTAMRTETKKVKEARELARKQRAGLRELTSAARRSTQHGADEDSDLEREKADDPWVGTSLHGFMTSPRKSQQALVGLHGVKSKTRAAAGFAKPDITSPVERNGLMDLDLTKRSSNSSTTEEPIRINDSETTSGDEDDLDATPSAPSHMTEAPAQSFNPLRKSAPTDAALPNKLSVGKIEQQGNRCEDQKHSATFAERAKTSPKPKPVNKFACFDDFDDVPSDLKTESALSEEPLEPKRGTKPRHPGKQEKPRQVTVVPTFLV